MFSGLVADHVLHQLKAKQNYKSIDVTMNMTIVDRNMQHLYLTEHLYSFLVHTCMCTVRMF